MALRDEHFVLWLLCLHYPPRAVISGPAIIQPLNAAGSHVRPKAPPSALILALFCSWAWYREESPKIYALFFEQWYDQLRIVYLVWMSIRKFDHVSKIYRYPTCVVCMVQDEQPRNNFNEGVHEHCEIWHSQDRTNVNIAISKFKAVNQYSRRRLLRTPRARSSCPHYPAVPYNRRSPNFQNQNNQNNVYLASHNPTFSQEESDVEWLNEGGVRKRFIRWQRTCSIDIEMLRNNFIHQERKGGRFFQRL